mmetsp:Transcript_14230/g.30469  ORF Transcript_14230/g.30469 Transcript_14230/m.30469 type:complete len:409 (-) Transcript_14230:74-1300(-)|eukprot:CAMPEP_0118933664 /NCGR_PEP_ID=MMETSP1169-20130426/12118_1 /TAXON_ID=36882 /ORGANISM="Pyramimonas obovata, Strain CCMP722" /LENGTH=408 /DNA_ID=CAMNT_0006876457 /DNA_START=91 /DNA_END=1317 /DNA_ORIENTATION=+
MTALGLVTCLLVAFGLHAHAESILPGSWAINYETNSTFGFGLPRTGRALLQENKNRVRYHPCGGAPAELMPFPFASSPWKSAPKATLHGPADHEVEDDNTDARRLQRRRLLNTANAGYVIQDVGCKKSQMKVYFENMGAGSQVAKKVSPSEKQLIKCLDNIHDCDMDAYNAAQKLTGVRRMKALETSTNTQAEMGGKRRFKTCALVGNAGFLLNHKLGQYIDQHEVVVRFNVMDVAGYEEHVGRKTTFRVLNHQRSTTGCCRGKLPENSTNNNPITVLLWHPGAQEEIATECKKRYPDNKVVGLSRGFIQKEVSVMKSLRMDMQRLGFGPFSSWRQLTTGAHAVLLFERLCDTVSVYGISAYGFKGPDQYAGRDKRSTGGRQWHDWKGESLVYRLLHASGRMTLCTVA